MDYSLAIIENSESNIKYLEKLLKDYRTGITIIKSERFEDVLDQLKTIKPDVIILSSRMLGNDEKALKNIRSYDSIKKFPVILYSENNLFETLSRDDVHDMIQFPFKREELFFRVRNAVYQHDTLKKLEEQHKRLNRSYQKNKRKTINLFGKHIDLKKAKKEIQVQNVKMEAQNAILEKAIVKNKKKTIDLFGKHIDLKKAKKEISQQKAKIEIQNRAITDSIQYASFIQNAVLAKPERIKEIIPDHFILYMPKDIVSGDFYWIEKIQERIFIVAADCTGHGVPGAFMSMLGMSLLNEIIIKDHSANANEILEELRDKVMQSLHQTGRIDEAADGMDIAFCIVDKKKGEIQFSGAHNPLYLFRDGELVEIKGDRMPIGFSLRMNKPFTNHILTYQKGDQLYLFSDGYPDQFGGEQGLKLRYRNFQHILHEIHTRSYNEQKELLVKRFYEWKGEYDQIDDILILACRL